MTKTERVGPLAGRVALVTGAGTGIGRQVALALAGEGAAVAVNYPGPGQEAVALEVQREIERDGGRALCVRADVRNETEVARMIEAAIATWGRLDILVNNAGIVRHMPIQEMTIEAWDEVMNVNLRSAFFGIKHALPGMLAQDYGRIINTASVLSFRGNVGAANYCAAKAGLLGLTRTAVLEIGARNVTVNCVAPARTVTAINQNSLTEEMKRQVSAKVPKGRMGEIADLIPCYLFLASEQSGFFTGQCMSPNGGTLMA